MSISSRAARYAARSAESSARKSESARPSKRARDDSWIVSDDDPEVLQAKRAYARFNNPRAEDIESDEESDAESDEEDEEGEEEDEDDLYEERDAHGLTWRERAERRAAGRDVDDAKNTYAYFATFWRGAARAHADGDEARARRLVARSYETFEGRAIKTHVERALHSFGRASSGSAIETARLDALRREGEVGALRVTKRAGGLERCGACGMTGKTCAYSASLAGTRRPIGNDCAVKLAALAKLYAHLRRGSRNAQAAAETRALLGALVLAQTRFSKNVEDLVYGRFGKARDDKEYVNVEQIARM
jgi:hypothetical protein